MSQIISASYDPSVSGLAGNVGDIVEVAGGASSWVKFDSGVTDWRPFPGDAGGGNSDGVTIEGDGSVADPFALVDDDVWFRTEKAALLALCPTLTRWEPVKLGVNAGGAAPATGIVIDVPVEGGGIGIASDASWFKATSVVYRTPKTAPWAMSLRAKFPAIGGSNNASYLGLITAALDHAVCFGWETATSASKWVLTITGQASIASTVNADTNLNTFRFYFNGTKIAALINGVEFVSTTTLTNVTDVGHLIGAFSKAANTPGVITSRMLFGYIDP